MSIIPVILCGGSGTRLWPLSRKSLPKQFAPLIDNKSLIEHTLIRLQAFKDDHGVPCPVMCVAAEEHRFFVQSAMQTVGSKGLILLEPVAKNTAPAMALAALKAKPDDLLLFCPADHHIADVEGFRDMVVQGVDAASQGQLVTFGVTPSFPSTAYGYIEVSSANLDLKGSKGSQSSQVPPQKVERFIEKPNAERAAYLIFGG